MELQSVGHRLRHERELRELSIDEVSKKTRIPRAMLENLEDDRFEQLPPDVFIRGFLRAYALAVGLDADAVVAHYSSVRPATGHPSLPIKPRASRPPYLPFALAAAMVFAFILLVFSVLRRPPAQDVPMELSRLHPCPASLSSHAHCSYDRSTTVTPIESSRC